jgi:hypothetical protein
MAPRFFLTSGGVMFYVCSKKTCTVSSANPMAGGQPTTPIEEAKFFVWTAHNLLKNLKSDEGIQKNPRESKPDSLVLFGLAWRNLACGLQVRQPAARA